MRDSINRRDFLKLAGIGGAVFISGLDGHANAASRPVEDFYFVQLSDAHWGFEGPPNPDARGTLPKAVAAVNSLERAPDFIMFTGDLTHTTDDPQERRKRLAQFKQIVAGLKVSEVHFMPGEHDAALDNGKAFKFFGGFHGEDGRAWLLAIVRNTFYSWHGALRERQQSMEFDEESLLASGVALAASPEGDPEALLMRKDDQRLLQQALAQLPVEYREVIVLRELGDLSYRQIAGIAGIPIGTVMSRLGRGRKLMAALLERALEQE